MSTISLLGLYEYDNSLFDNMTLPSQIDRRLLIDNLLMETADLEVLYSDAEFMKFAIIRWSVRQLPVWEKMLELFKKEYNPIFNVDAEESETITREQNKNTSNKNSLKSDDRTNIQVTDAVSGFNDENFKNSSQTSTASSNYSTADNAGTEAVKDDETISTVKKRGGNIGVTMTQQMIEAEMRVRPQMNIYKYIIEDFKQRFCLLIY